VFAELAAARLFEAVGIDDLLVTSVVDPLNPNGMAIISKEIPNDGLGRAFQGDRLKMKNARELALIDYLIENNDRHRGNWVFKGDTVYPIDHGLTHFGYDAPRTLRSVRGSGDFAELINNWARNPKDPNFALFTQEEFIQIRQNILGLKDMYEAKSPAMARHFNDVIAPRLDVLLKIWS